MISVVCMISDDITYKDAHSAMCAYISTAPVWTLT